MALKLNVNRTFKQAVPVRFYNEEGKILTGSFTGEFKVLKAEDFDDKETKFIDHVLVSVDGIELADEHGNLLTGSELLEAVKNDTDLATACIDAYNESVEKKRVKPQISKSA